HREGGEARLHRDDVGPVAHGLRPQQRPALACSGRGFLRGPRGDRDEREERRDTCVAVHVHLPGQIRYASPPRISSARRAGAPGRVSSMAGPMRICAVSASAWSTWYSTPPPNRMGKVSPPKVPGVTETGRSSPTWKASASLGTIPTVSPS